MADKTQSPVQVDRQNQDARLDRLEEGQFFQEKNLAELNTALLHQQRQIDTLEHKLAVAEEKLALLLAQIDQSGGEPTLPPHFMPERY